MEGDSSLRSERPVKSLLREVTEGRAAKPPAPLSPYHRSDQVIPKEPRKRSASGRLRNPLYLYSTVSASWVLLMSKKTEATEESSLFLLKSVTKLSFIDVPKDRGNWGTNIIFSFVPGCDFSFIKSCYTKTKEKLLIHNSLDISTFVAKKLQWQAKITLCT